MINGFIPTYGFPTVLAELEEQFSEGEKLTAMVRESLEEIQNVE